MAVYAKRHIVFRDGALIRDDLVKAGAPAGEAQE